MMDAEGSRPEPPRTVVHLDWLDGMKGIAILWIAFFHAFSFLGGSDGRFPSPLADGYVAKSWGACAPASAVAALLCGLETFAAAFGQLGFHAVAVFLVLSGFGLSYSLAKTGEPPNGWIGWYRSRLLRLFPMYWVAHLVYLILPFQARYEPIDYRFALSFLGDRVWPVDMIFYYFNPALWYFGLLLELYAVFPALFWLLKKAGVGGFLVSSAIATVGCRYVLLCVWPVNGYYVQGAFFVCRLWEFALGMAVGFVYRTNGERVERWLFSLAALAAGIVLYTLGLYSYGRLWSYCFTDALIGTGLFVILARVARSLATVPGVGALLAIVGVYSYGLYLLHQPFVLYFAARMLELSTPRFVMASVALIAVLAAASMVIERWVNRIAQRALR
jgi:peptidoglycan/LPS O-acetylase OafA/YrhL